MRLLYNTGIFLLGRIIGLLAIFKSKPALWKSGRKNWEQNLKSGLKQHRGIIWFHCSSLGEFEQGRPVIEALEKNGEKILLSFFSPSGYENLKNFKSAVYVCYLPLDSADNARKWLEIIQPKAAFFVKYEFWFNYINELYLQKIPLFLISGIFRKNQYFFKPYGEWFAGELKKFTHFFVQDEESVKLLNHSDISQVSLSGDTRFDRVKEIAAQRREIPEIADFCSNGIILVAGSTWGGDEEVISSVLGEFPELKLVIAPHEVNETRLNELKNTIVLPHTLLSSYNPSRENRILIIDKIGYLSVTYRYGNIAYIGGGFDKGIHNTLEAAVYGLPLIFGPKYDRFREAREMIGLKSAFSIQDREELYNVLKLLLNENQRRKIGSVNAGYVEKNQGGTEKILYKLKELNLIK